jgi:hypothetical protein
MTKNDLVEIYRLGNDDEISHEMLHDLHKWASFGAFKLGCMTKMNKSKVWYVGFDRPLTDLIHNYLYTKTGILLWDKNPINFIMWD